MKKIEGFAAIAPKIKSGEVEYCLWTDNDGALYVQIIRNIVDATKAGTHSNLLFRVSEYLGREESFQKMHGYNPVTFVEETSKDNNDAGFVKAILKQLFQ